MKNNFMIKVTTLFQEREQKGKHWKTYRDTEDLLTYEQYRKSFEEEKWSTDKRQGKQFTELGTIMEKLITENPYSDSTNRTVRTFECVNVKKADSFRAW